MNTHNNTINHNLNILVIYGGEAKEEVEGNKEYKTLQEWENDFNQSHPNCPINVIECPNKFSDLIDKF
ncbi:hypothetical protein CWATWH0402_2465 [Crocosphaera watsonii WH 0402]|uniref:Uncharacterized protein n=1 Tax=Crocosphaera watsonii WH 0402 TaxID=1284629 RepID=T2JZW5_CROWT|nr:hypothetical protein CWATWH0402_2465 [Crocosphaera watsonii WH 0402]